MNPCPCGLTREELNMHHLVGPDGVCIAVDVDGNHCGRRLADHPHGPPVQMQEAAPMMTTPSADIIAELTQQMQSIAFSQLTLLSRLPTVIETVITPSVYAKSAHNNVFQDVLSTCGFPTEPLFKFVQKDLSSLHLGAPRSPSLDYTFRWKDDLEEEKSYQPLQDFLELRNIVVENVANGQGLIDGLLFNEEIWTLKKNIRQRSSDLKSEPCLCKYIIRGRTDFVRLTHRRYGVSKRNIQYYIEIKKGTITEVELKEAFYQLLGGNVANCYRSPPVFLTNLSKSHFVLFITQCSNPIELLQYELQIFQFPTFGSAMNYLEDTTRELKSCTRDFLRRPTPLSTPPKNGRDGEDSDDGLVGSKVCVEEVLDVEDSL